MTEVRVRDNQSVRTGDALFY
ncbi:hypothetical protein PX699_30075 [Sphingobium sp. H39-3-25]|nr:MULTISPECIES: biotin/lipoyl-binding protein [Sphingomonadaceae]MDF0546604.1 hypothetical protein [Sphingobium arseniciresistens]